MITTLVVTFLRQRASSPIRMLMLLLFGSLPAFMGWATQSLAVLAGLGTPVAILLAAGGIGQDVSSGVLQLVFARPVPRAHYVFARWLACVIAVAVVALGQVAFVSIGLVAGGHTSQIIDGVPLLIENILDGAAAAALMLALSACVGGLGDLAIWFIATMGAQLSGLLAKFKHWPMLERAASEIGMTLNPKVELAWLAGHGSPAFAGLALVLSTTALGLAVAMTLVTRREISYAD